MSILLLGDPTETYTHANLIGSSAQEAWKYTALKTGIVRELRFRTNDITNTGTTQVELGVYSDAADAPDELLGSGVAAGQPATDTWISVTGLSIPVVEGQDYWLAADPAEGGLHFNTAVISGGSPDWAVGNGDGPLTATWDVGSSDPDYEDGPIGFQALGDLTPPARVFQPDLQWAVTTLHRPEKTTSPIAAAEVAQPLAWAIDPMDDLVTIARNEKRLGEVAFSFDDPICAELYRIEQEAFTNHEIQVAKCYEAMLFARWRPFGEGTITRPVIWAPIVDMDWRSSERKVVVSCVQEQRLVAHQIHNGDDAYEHDKHEVTVGGFGFDEIIQAADVAPDQLDDGTPDHGINKPGNAGDSTLRMAIALDDGVWDKVVELSEIAEAADFAVIPRDIEDPGDPPMYADLVIYEDGQGSDQTDSVQFEAKFGRDNAVGVDWGAGGPYLTHAVVRNRSNTSRVPRANVAARRRTGVYVHRENIASDSPDGTMTSRAEALVDVYSAPADRVTVKLRPWLQPLESGARNPNLFLFLFDFDLGDWVRAEERDAYYHKRAVGQINEVRLRRGTQDDDKHLIYQEIDVVSPPADEVTISDEAA